MLHANKLDPVVDRQREQLARQLVDGFGYKQAMNALAQMSGYESTPPTILEFLFNHEYMGEVLGENLFPVWRAALEEIYANPFYSPYREIMITGAIGLGKSTFSLAGNMYDACRMLHLKNPHKTFGILKTDPIVFAMVSATKDLAEKNLLSQWKELAEASPYFLGQMEKAKDKGILFPKKITAISASRKNDLLGKAVAGALLSELNDQKAIKGQAEDNYSGVLSRQDSRFGTAYSKTGSWAGRIWLDSSRKDSDSFLDVQIDKGRNRSDVRVFDYAQWEVHAFRGRYSGETFKVFIGSSTRDPFILTNPKQIVGLDDTLIIDVPIELKQHFVSDIYKSLQDLAGKGTWSAHKFIPSTERIGQAMTKVNPVRREVIQLDFYETHDQLINYLDQSALKITVREPRYIHIDVGLTKDKLGIASCYVAGYVTRRHTNVLDGSVQETREPVYMYDWLICVEAKAGQEIPFYKIKEFLFLLRSQFGYPIAKVSADGYQSRNLRQDLELAGFESTIESVDRFRDAYDSFKMALLAGRLNLPKHSLLETELKNIMDLGNKIDHPMENPDGSRGSKDLADACCGAAWIAYQALAKDGGITSRDILGMLGDNSDADNESTYASFLQNRDDRFMDDFGGFLSDSGHNGW